MTDAEMSEMTLGELEALAKRFGTAVSAIKEARALLGFISLADTEKPLLTHKVNASSQLNASESEERERLLRQFRHDGLPENIKKLEET